MKPAAVLTAVGAVLLFARLGEPALWQDEAETAMRAVTILETGLPRTHLNGVLVTAQSSLAAVEGNSAGVWTWNTWLPAYLVAGSFAVLGRTPFAARLPFALAALLTLWLSWRLFRDANQDRPWASESGLAVLAFSAPFLLFARQSRYYALVALGTVLVLFAWRALLTKRPRAGLALALALNFLLHASFAFFAIAALALALDAALRREECVRESRFGEAAVLTAALAVPAAWYFRVWDRPGNHGYAAAEGLEFLKTFLLWGARFVVPAALPAAVLLKRAALGRKAAPLLVLAAGAAVYVGLSGEGVLSRLAALAALGGLAAEAFVPARRGVMELRRMSALFLCATLVLLSFTAAEPYGRYLAGVLPLCAFVCGRWVSELAGGRPWVVAGLTVLLVVEGGVFAWPARAAAALAAPAPAESVSGMMRLRLRETPRRGELARFVAGLGRPGYVEPAAEAMRAGGGRTYFSDGDSLSLMFATGLEPVYDLAAEPDWLFPSPWLRLSPVLDARVRELAASGRYAPAGVEAPRLLWQNNPDPLFRDPAPPSGPLPLWRRVSPGRGKQ